MQMNRTLFALAALVGLSSQGYAQISDEVVRIGILGDMSGVYSEASGLGTVEAATMAIEDFGGEVNGYPIDIVSADHQNRPDLGSAIATEWFDRSGVDMIADLPGSAVAIAVQNVGKERGKVVIGGAAGTAELTGNACSPTGVHYIYDTYSLAKGSVDAALETIGDSFYFITVDYTFGHQLEGAITNFVEQAGGSVAGGVRHPLAATDFSSFILQAQASDADIIVLANASTDTANAIQTAREFGIFDEGQSVLAMLLMDTDIRAIGLEAAQDLLLVSPFFWNRTDESTEWSRRYYERTGAMPTLAQAGAYSYTMHYLNAVEAAGTDDGKAVVDKMKELPIDDWFAQGMIREDGRMVHDMYLVRVKSPDESTEEWDYFDLVQVLSGEEIFRPMSEGGCDFITEIGD